MLREAAGKEYQAKERLESGSVSLLHIKESGLKRRGGPVRSGCATGVTVTVLSPPLSARNPKGTDKTSKDRPRCYFSLFTKCLPESLDRIRKDCFKVAPHPLERGEKKLGTFVTCHNGATGEDRVP